MTTRLKTRAAAAAAPKRVWPSPVVKARLTMVIRISLLLWICLLAYQVRYHPVGSGHDSSGYAMNYAHAKGAVFGRDVAWTYGPLAYLIVPMPVAGNLTAGIVFQVAVWICFAAVSSWIIFVRKVPLGRVLMFGVCLFLATGLFHEFGYAGPDMFLELLGLMLLGGSLGSRRPMLWFGGACAMAIPVFFVKFSTALGIVSALGLFTIALLLTGARRGRYYLLCLAALPPAILLTQILLFGPPAALWGYIRAAQDLSAGYGVALSFGSDTNGLWTALALMAAWIVMTAVLYWRKLSAWMLSFSCLGLLFFEFKHSFVREPGHIEIFFLFIPLLCGWLVLFTEFRKRDWYTVGALLIIAVLWYPRESARVGQLRNPLSPVTHRYPMSELFHLAGIRQRMEPGTVSYISRQRLSPELLARIGSASMAGFPMECGYAAANPVNMRLFPIFQWYMAYTPYLDGRNAAFLEDARTAPEFLVFDWEAIDDRHPLLDSPGATVALIRHYELDGMYGEQMLLRRRKQPRFGAWRVLETRQLSLRQPVHVPASNHPLAGRIHLAWNTQGKLMKFFWRLPEVRLVASSAAGRGLDVRIPPEVLEDGVPLNLLPFDQEAMRTVFSGAPLPDRVETLLVGGPGAAYLEPSARVEILQAADQTLPFALPQAPDFESLQYRGELNTARIELLNDTGASAFSVVTVPNQRGYLRVQGWAAIDGEPAGAVLVEVDGKARPAEYGRPRGDVQALLHAPGALRAGFEWAVPAWDLGQSWHELALKILTKDGKGYYDGARKLRFRME